MPGRRRDRVATWIELLAAYVRARLVRAGVARSGYAAACLLCRQPASVAMTALAIDATFALAALPIEVRRAGLDRDPGWVPAGARTLRFHFE
jgi:hypothetical protein